MTSPFIQMNEDRRRASARVQRVVRKLAQTIDEPGQPAGYFVIR
jgi:hypothetical protein